MAPARVERSESGFAPVWASARSGVALISHPSVVYGVAKRVTERVGGRDTVVTLNTYPGSTDSPG